MHALGIDVGGTGIKANIVDTKTGEFLREKYKIKTPNPADPNSIIECLKGIVDHYKWNNQPIGVGFPSVISNGISKTASNIDQQFIGYPINQNFSAALGCPVKVVNDADVAGIAEIKFGSNINKNGLVILITLGTGIGSALFFNGTLIPNTEMGHLLYKKSVFEKYASNSARTSKKLSWQKWGKELNVYLNHLSLILSPNLILIGGGVSKYFDEYKNYLTVDTEIRRATLLNEAGILGAAMASVDGL